MSDVKNWSLTVDDITNTPLAGLTISPAFTGTITDTLGVIGFDVSGSDETSFPPVLPPWPSATSRCPTRQHPTVWPAPAMDGGQVWFDVEGKLDDDTAGVHADAEACLVPAANAFTISTTASTTLLPDSAGFTVTDAAVRVGGAVGGAITVTASATLTVTEGLARPLVLPVTVAFADDGSLTASAAVDLGALGLVADVSGANANEGAGIDQWTYNGEWNQQWLLRTRRGLTNLRVSGVNDFESYRFPQD